MDSTIASLPDYLKTYVVTQDPQRYSTRDHASWRYIMRQSRTFFKDHAVPIYLKGLEYTGITLDRIPLISEMDAKLKRLGWGAVPVCGFIPPAAFLDFQSRKILPIAFDMRNIDNIAYTPAPDIVHEAAGHAPIIADEEYSEYLTMYANMAQKAIFSQEDLDLYEAIRTLSDVKESPDSSPEKIALAEAALERATAALSFVSEANKVARMNWWTVEYGLLGSLEHPKIYGAGLLSSVGESQNCLSSKVKKLRLSLACVDTPYNITEPQPQLFVAEDIAHLVAVLKECESMLAFRKGGIYGLSQAKAGRTVTTTVLDSGLHISGRLEQFTVDDEAVTFFRMAGPVQLCHEGKEISGHGAAHHPHGFSSPLGRLKNRSDLPLAKFTDEDLKKAGLKVGQRTLAEFTTGFVVEGHLHKVWRSQGNILLLTWQDATVRKGTEILFRPEWGDFDMAVGEKVVSVFGGPADRQAYPLYETGKASTSPARQSPYSDQEISAFSAYGNIRTMRDDLRWGRPKAFTADDLLDFAERLTQSFPDEWLLILEALELSHGYLHGNPSVSQKNRMMGLAQHLSLHGTKFGATRDWLVRQGLAIASIPD